jgi:hypothetical protein
MPVRVKCRCGQELVLRYGEWVYFLLGLVLLCLVANSAALLLLHFRIDETASSARTAAPPASVLPGAPRVDEGPRVVESGGGDAKPEPREGAVEPPVRPAGEDPPAVPESEGGGDSPLPVRPAEEGKAPVGASAVEAILDPDPEVASILSVLPPWKEGVKSGTAPRQTPPLPAAPWSKEPVVVRFLVLERAPTQGLIRHAFLLDPDRRLRRAAVDRVRSLPVPAGDDALLARRVLEAAAPYLEGDPNRAAVFEAHGLESGEESAAAPGLDIEKILGSLGERAAPVLSDPALASVRSFATRVAENGMDIVLLIDVSRSMEGVLEPLQHDSLWLFPAMGWAFPGVRIGIALYRDGIEAARGFSGPESEDLVRILREARAEGGGDVPEGVHRAVEEALSLGRFAWRPGAEKHIVIIGDAPPPHPEQAPLISLAGRAFREGGYRFHAVSIRPDEGRPAIISFPEVAASGGGTAVTIDQPERLGEEIFWRFFPPDALEALRPLAARLRALFSVAGA